MQRLAYKNTIRRFGHAKGRRNLREQPGVKRGQLLEVIGHVAEPVRGAEARGSVRLRLWRMRHDRADHVCAVPEEILVSNVVLALGALAV